MRKKEQRKILLDTLSKVSSGTLKKSCKNISRQFYEFLYSDQMQCIGLYYPLSGELPTFTLMQSLQDMGKVIYLPYKDSLDDGTFKSFSKGQVLELNASKFPEPTGEKVKVSELDLLLVPLLGFDLNGGRLGRGGGFYDQLIGKFLDPRSLQVVGLGLDIQEVENLPQEIWDQKLNAVLTPTRFLNFKH